MHHRRILWFSGSLVLAFGLSIVAAHAAGQHAHVHGEGRINIAVEGQQGAVEFIAPAEGVYGFEHRATTPADQAKRDAALTLVREHIGSMVIFAADRGCQWTPQSVTVVAEAGRASSKGGKQHGEHSEVHAVFTVTCAQPLAGSQVTFGVSKVLPKIRVLHVQVLSGTKQSGAVLKGDKGKVTL